MKKITISLLAAVLMALPIVFGGVVINSTPGNGTTAPVSADPELIDWFTVYPLENCSPNYNPVCTQLYNTRNSVYPEYEFAFTGDVLHFQMRVSDDTINGLEVGTGNVDLLCGGAGTFTDVAPLSPCTGTSPTLNTATGRYERDYCGDYTVNSGIINARCTIRPKFDDDGAGPGLYHNFAIFPSSTYPIYENVNEILYNPTISTTAPATYTWTLYVNQYSHMTPYPATFGFTSLDDSEGQGVIGKLFTRTLIFDCINPVVGQDINTDQVRYRVAPNPTWTSLPANQVWAMVEDGVSTSGTGFSRQFYYEVFFPASNSCLAFSANSGMPQAAFATY